jgi:universal stress protein A
MPKYKHLLLAVDLADDSNKLVNEAVELAQLFSSELTIVHTIEPLPAYGYPGISGLESPVIDHAKQEMLELGKSHHLDERHIRVEFGSVKTQILRVAKELDVDLILIGSHGRHGLSKLLGSSASAIVHGADCDVFVIRSHR